jgi:hypothetical protein
LFFELFHRLQVPGHQHSKSQLDFVDIERSSIEARFRHKAFSVAAHPNALNWQTETFQVPNCKHCRRISFFPFVPHQRTGGLGNTWPLQAVVVVYLMYHCVRRFSERTWMSCSVPESSSCSSVLVQKIRFHVTFVLMTLRHICPDADHSESDRTDMTMEVLQPAPAFPALTPECPYPV